MNILKKIKTVSVACALVAFSISVHAKESDVLKPFQGYSASSDYTITYDDLNLLLDSSVLYVGRSKRTKAEKSKGSVGTRFKNKVNKLTENEANRFFFEAFRDEDKAKYVTNIRESLEQLPSDAPLDLFNKDEQIAFWLNLYNVTLLDEMIKAYPKNKDMEDYLVGRNSLLNKKLLNVANIPLSLNDIHYKILKPKFDDNPLIIYGLYQGNIGGPNIRKQAFTGPTVHQQLIKNAEEFINSNRGTYGDDKKTFRVSSLYERNAVYFDNFNKDLKDHILTYLEGYTRYQLENARKIKANIDNWKITDLYGSVRQYGAGINNNNAALQDSISNPYADRENGGGVVDLSMASNFSLNKTVTYGRFSPEQAERLNKMKEMKEDNKTSVTITDIEKKKKSNKN